MHKPDLEQYLFPLSHAQPHLRYRPIKAMHESSMIDYTTFLDDYWVLPKSTLRRSILHGCFDNPRQCLPPILSGNVANTRSEIQHTPLGNRPVNKLGHIRARIPDRRQTARHAEVVQETRDRIEEMRAEVSVGDAQDAGVCWRHAIKNGERGAVAVRR